jgi:hypothetical protein
MTTPSPQLQPNDWITRAAQDVRTELMAMNLDKSDYNGVAIFVESIIRSFAPAPAPATANEGAVNELVEAADKIILEMGMFISEAQNSDNRIRKITAANMKQWSDSITAALSAVRGDL